FHESKPQVDRYAAPLFLGQPVGVRAGQRFDQCGLAVVDVPGRADNHAFRGGRHVRKRAKTCIALDANGGTNQGPNCEVYSAAAISSTMACVAARGSAAARMGLPTTRKSAPARIASVGVAFLAWSSDFGSTAESFGRTPGVTIRKSRPQALRIARTSCTEATTPSTP